MILELMIILMLHNKLSFLNISSVKLIFRGKLLESLLRIICMLVVEVGVAVILCSYRTLHSCSVCTP